MSIQWPAIYLAFLFFCGFLGLSAPAHADLTGKKVLYIDSYHAEMVWIQGITSGIREALEGTGVELEIFQMDTKRNEDNAFVQESALNAKAKIESYQPDVVIVSDDNAIKYVLMQYYKNAELPFIFCGMNAKLSDYGMPYQNATGMLEVSLAKQIVGLMQSYAKGKRLGGLGVNRTSQREIERYHEEAFGIVYEKFHYVDTFEEWKAAYLALQDEVDMIFIQTMAGISGWNDEEAIAFVRTHTKIPTATERRSTAPFSMLAIAIVPEEHGRWSANAALQILNGTAPTSIPITENKDGQLIINLAVAESAGIVFNRALLEMAEIIH